MLIENPRLSKLNTTFSLEDVVFYVHVFRRHKLTERLFFQAGLEARLKL